MFKIFESLTPININKKEEEKNLNFYVFEDRERHKTRRRMQKIINHMAQQQIWYDPEFRSLMMTNNTANPSKHLVQQSLL